MTPTALANAVSHRADLGVTAAGRREEHSDDRTVMARWIPHGDGFVIISDAGLLKEGTRVQVRRRDGTISTETVGRRIEADVAVGMACASVRREQGSFWNRRGRFG